MLRHFSHVWHFATLWPAACRLLCPWDSLGKKRILRWVAMPSSRGSSLPHPFCLLHWQVGSLPWATPGNLFIGDGSTFLCLGHTTTNKKRKLFYLPRHKDSSWWRNKKGKRLTLLYPFLLIYHCFQPSVLHELPGPSQNTKVPNLEGKKKELNGKGTFGHSKYPLSNLKHFKEIIDNFQYKFLL